MTNNPFEELMKELVEIKGIVKLLRASHSPAIEIINRKELQKRLAITEPTVIRWSKRGTIPEIRIGTNIRYNWPAVVEALEGKKIIKNSK